METKTAQQIDYQVITSNEDLLKIIPELEKAQTLSLDTEGNKLDPLTSKLFLLQVAVGTKAWVIDCQKVDLSPIKPVLEGDRPLKIAQNAKFDYSLLKAQAGITLGNMYDTMLAERLLTCGISREVSLRALADKYLGIKLDKTTRESFSDPTNPALHGKFTKEQLDYAARDAIILQEIFQKQFVKLKEESLVETAKLEFAVIPVVAEMELRGTLIDKAKWKEHIAELAEKRNAISKEIQDELRHLTEYSQVDLFGNVVDSINLDSPMQLIETFRKLGVELVNTSESTLSKIDHPLAKKLLEYRGYEKMITSFGDSILEKIHPLDGRLHPDFLQLGADTGRFACNNPNLQQIPADSGFRSCFIASPGYKLITADYSQMELRIMAEVSEDPVFLKAFNEDVDLHTLTASQMFRVEPDKVDKQMRFQAKSINFGLMYGRGATSLGLQIGLSMEESKKLLDVYFSTYKKVKKWLDNMGRGAVRYGYVSTIGGRKRSFIMPEKTDPEYKRLIGSIERQGKNMPIQGTSADITKYALVYIYDYIKENKLDAHLIHTVHDEIVTEAREDIAEDLSKVVEEKMVEAGKKLLKLVPVKVEVNVGDVWQH